MHDRRTVSADARDASGVDVEGTDRNQVNALSQEMMAALQTRNRSARRRDSGAGRSARKAKRFARP